MDTENNFPSAAPETRLEVVKMPDYKPVMTYIILGITVIIYTLQMASSYWLDIDILAVFGSKINDAILAGQFWRLLTPMLLHHQELFFHILFNMYFLAVIGPRLEKFTNHLPFLLLYILAGFSGNVFSFLFSPANSLGASTSLYGLMGAQMIFVLHNRSFLVDNGKAALQNILVLIGINVAISFFFIAADNWGHIGGLVGGTLFAWFGGPKLDLEEISFPRFQLVDVRTWGERLLGAALVLLIFGGFAVLKITGIAF